MSGNGVNVGSARVPAAPVACDCGITDSFTRTVSGGWGTSDDGPAWDPGTHFSVNGTQGLITLAPGEQDGEADLSYAGAPAQANILIEGLTLTVNNDNSGSDPLFEFSFGGYHIRWAMGEPHHGNTWFFQGGTTASFSGPGPFNVRIQADATGASARMWAVGSAEPGTWDITHAAYSGFQNDFVGVYANNRVTTTGHTFVVAVDNLDITGVNRCTAVQFDDFDRTVASGWGNATPSGAAWAMTHAGSGPATSDSVDGSNGVIVVDGSQDTYRQAAVAGSGPWSSGRFMMTQRFMINDTGFFKGFDYFISTSVGSSIAMVELGAVGLGTVYLSLQGQVPSHTGSAVVTLAINTWYWLKWDYHSSDTHVRAKIWADGTAEPGTWNVDFDDLAIGTLPVGFYQKIYTHSTYVTTLTVDSIDFDYAGRPCYYDCGGITDTFTRTVTSGWGTADCGIAWALDGSSGTLPPDILSVSGGLAYLHVDEGDGAGGYAQLNLPFAGVLPIDVLVKASISASAYGNADGIFIAIDSAVGGAGAYVGVQVSPAGNAPVIGIQTGGPLGPGSLWVVDASNNPAPSSRHIYKSSGAVLSGGYAAFTDTHFFWVRLHYEATVLRARAWWDGDAEPGSWAASATPQASFTPAAIDIESYSGAFGGWQDLHVDSVDITGVNSCVPVTGGGPAPATPMASGTQGA